uniref:Sulfatase N-terminal domain-containing protein n=1 Tax=Strigamia maritima TaxID=126957 RepID=T1J5L9_STRMM
MRKRFDYYFKMAKPAVKLVGDPKGDSANFGGVYTPGWCNAYDDVPKTQEGHNDVGWNNSNMYTPHMDKLAREGVILDQFYAMPLCTPSRASFLSGLYAQQLGLQRGVLWEMEPYGIPLKYKLLPEVLKSKSYRSHAVGKWHLGFCDWRYTPTHRGFDSFLVTAPDSIFMKMTDMPKNITGQYSQYLQNDRAVEIIEQHRKYHPQKPLFLYVGSSATHFPGFPCFIARNKNYLYYIPLMLVQADRFARQCENQTETRREFCGAVMGMDEVVHNITKALKQNNLYCNSIFAFASDESVSEDKPSPRTEFPYSMDIIEGTRIGAVRVGDYKLIDGPAGLNDKWIIEKETVDKSYDGAFTMNLFNQRSFFFNLTDRSSKLYNLAVDPNERHNLANKEPEKLAELRKRFDYYFNMAKPAVKLVEDPKGDPVKFGDVYSPGWCNAYEDVPKTHGDTYYNKSQIQLVLN